MNMQVPHKKTNSIGIKLYQDRLSKDVTFSAVYLKKLYLF